MQFCTTERPQLYEFEVVSCTTCRLTSKKAILEVAMSNLQKRRGFAQSWESLHADLTPPNISTYKFKYLNFKRYFVWTKAPNFNSLSSG